MSGGLFAWRGLARGRHAWRAYALSRDWQGARAVAPNGLARLEGVDLPRALDPPPAGGQSVVFRSSGHLGAFHFSIAFSMPSWIDLGSIFPPNLPPKIHQNPLKIDTKMPSHVDSIF